MPDGDPVSVQFNPATLRLSRRNNVDRTGVTTGSQKRHQPAPEAATLAFDLEFDTSEQGQPGQWVDVRRWTALVRQFVEPSTQAPKARSARGPVRLGDAGLRRHHRPGHRGAGPLRAGRHAAAGEGRRQHRRAEPGLRNRPDRPGSTDRPGPLAPHRIAAPAGRPGNAGTEPHRPGGTGPGQGESAQQLLARLGLDPSGWRAAMTGLQTPLGLPAGDAVQLGPEVPAGGPVTAAPGAGFAGPGAVASPADAGGRPDRGNARGRARAGRRRRGRRGGRRPWSGPGWRPPDGAARAAFGAPAGVRYRARAARQPAVDPRAAGTGGTCRCARGRCWPGGPRARPDGPATLG